MSRAYEMISESLNEIIEDFEKNDGKNLKCDIVENENFEQKKFSAKKYFEGKKNYSRNFSY